MSSGIYIHIPFCRSRCSYCDFATDVYRSAEIVENYVSALVTEIESFDSVSLTRPLSQTILTRVDTIYFGGGTPSLLSGKQVAEILAAVHNKFSVAADSEITMEMNPATVTLDTLKDYKSLGVNRASFGAQTFDDAELKRLGRKHTAADVRETIELLRRAGFGNVSFDLIAGLPRQTLKGWARNLDEALNLQPEHLSLYLLEIHEATPLAEQIRRGRQPLPDEELAAAMYELMCEKVSSKNYRQYEISNFCQPNRESLHNSKYWTLAPVFGFGCSAHSFDGADLRYSNERDTARYVAMIESKGSAVVEKNKIDAASEFAFLGLRLTKGVDADEYEKLFAVNLREKHGEDLKQLEDFGLIEFSGNRLKLTGKGFLFSNEVFAVFV